MNELWIAMIHIYKHKYVEIFNGAKSEKIYKEIKSGDKSLNINKKYLTFLQQFNFNMVHMLK